MATILLTVEEITTAWQWALENMSQRPNLPNHPACIYDHKVWAGQPLNYQDQVAVNNVGRLYLISQLGDEQAIMNMANSRVFQALVYQPPQLDRDVQVIVKSVDRFRDHLSEHLAFWVRLAAAAQTLADGLFMCPSPNFQPEDKGPDGLFVFKGAIPHIEPQSVKNSTSNPRGLIASATFRRNGHVNDEQPGYRPKQLEGFYLASHQDWGFGRMDRLLAHTARLLNMTLSEKVRFALVGRCSYNAVVVANERYADEDLFDGYQHITNDIKRHFATYIGADNWKCFAERVRHFVHYCLSFAGVM